ncbi:MAG: ABC transporter ATP-binding protein [Trueperaceae bacterium]
MIGSGGDGRDVATCRAGDADGSGEALALHDVRFAYPSGPEVVRGASARFPRGRLVGIVGPNGAGKSSLIGLASGVLTPSAGDVVLEGTPLRRFGRRPAARRIAVVPQRAELPAGFSVRSVVAMGRAPYLGFFGSQRAHDVAICETAMRRTDVWRFRDTPVQRLSGGEAQRVVLARALAQEPTWLLLDEPTTHLDLRFQAEVLDRAVAAARSGLGVVAVLHDLNHAARCDTVLMLDQGRIVAEGPPSEVFDEERVRRVFGTRVRIVRDGDRPVVVPS